MPEFVAAPWFAIVAPAGTPKAIVAKVNAEMMRILATPEVREMLAAQGATPGKGSPADLAKFADEEIAKWAKVIKDGNIKAE